MTKDDDDAFQPVLDAHGNNLYTPVNRVRANTYANKESNTSNLLWVGRLRFSFFAADEVAKLAASERESTGVAIDRTCLPCFRCLLHCTQRLMPCIYCRKAPGSRSEQVSARSESRSSLDPDVHGNGGLKFKTNVALY